MPASEGRLWLRADTEAWRHKNEYSLPLPVRWVVLCRGESLCPFPSTVFPWSAGSPWSMFSMRSTGPPWNILTPWNTVFLWIPKPVTLKLKASASILEVSHQGRRTYSCSLALVKKLLLLHPLAQANNS